MKNYEAIGVVEALFMTTAIEIMDQMCKSSDVEFLSSEKVLGGRLVTVIVGGSVSNVSTALEAAELVCQSKPENPLKLAILISKPSEEIMKFIVPQIKEIKAIEEQKTEEVEPEKTESVETIVKKDNKKNS